MENLGAFDGEIIWKAEGVQLLKDDKGHFALVIGDSIIIMPREDAIKMAQQMLNTIAESN